ncbi:MAG: hypothetical protein CL608_08900 [Anaerolineaceae bacterium]|nr:hypothetical protein [Anaerolineaceae bacterium]
MITKYEQLKNAQNKDIALWDDYEMDCKGFIANLREALFKELDCRSEHIEWVRYANDLKAPDLYTKWDEFMGSTIRKFPIHRTMVLYNNGFWSFTFKIILNDGSLILRFKLKKVESTYHLYHENEYTVVEGDEEQMQNVVESIVGGSISYFQTRFDNFIKGLVFR